jgi:hypothetical protein
MRYVVTSTWGQHHVVADSEEEAEEAAVEELRPMYANPDNMINDGMTEEYDPEWHGGWQGEEVAA